jgi:serine/threonine protein phosphatase PrpC
MLEIAYITSCGGRSENEDNLCILKEEDDLCMVVADGLGGYGGGKVASRAVVDTFAEHFKKNGLRTREQLQTALSNANERVISGQTPECEMKSTLVLLVLHGKNAEWMHVGDSRLYHFKDGMLVDQTLDHSVSQLAVFMNEIAQEDIRFHEDRSKVLRALGSDSFDPDIMESLHLEEGFHAFLLCSDGFWEYVYEKEMEAMLSEASSPKEWLTSMEQIIRGRAPKDQDNYTAAAVFVL